MLICSIDDFARIEESNMNVFVTGTGRCGTVTFSKAAEKIQNFSAGHETKAGCLDERRWDYPPHHIEVDPHLSWTLGTLIARYPDAYYVHLQRNRDEVVESWFRRGIRSHSGAAPLIDVIFQTKSHQIGPEEYRRALGLLYDVVNDNIEAAFRQVNSRHIWLHQARQGFCRLWDDIGAVGNRDSALREFDVRYNAS